MALTAQTRDAFERLGAAVVAVADPDPAALQTTAELLDLAPSALFADFSSLLELNPPLDAILIASPMEYHAAQSIAALERGIHVLCEVTLAVTVDECKAVVQAAERSSAVYMMAENYLWAAFTTRIAELVEQGRFGQVYYAEAEYKSYMRSSSTEWRRHWMVGRHGVTCAPPRLDPQP